MCPGGVPGNFISKVAVSPADAACQNGFLGKLIVIAGLLEMRKLLGRSSECLRESVLLGKGSCGTTALHQMRFATSPDSEDNVHRSLG